MPEENNEPIYKIPPMDMREAEQSWLSSHRILGVVFLIVVGAAIVSGIYYWETTRNIPATVNPPQHNDETRDWEAYLSDDYGFEIKYPDTWSLAEQDKKVILSAPNEETRIEIDNEGNLLSVGAHSPDVQKIISTFKPAEPTICVQVIAHARNPQTGEVRDFPTPCDIPNGWEQVQPEMSEI